MGDSDRPEETKKLKRTQADREKEEAEEEEAAAEETGEGEEEEGEDDGEDGPQFVDLDGGAEMGYLVEDDAGDACDEDEDDGNEGEKNAGDEGNEAGQEVPDMGEEEPVVEITDMAIAKFDEHSDSVLCVDVLDGLRGGYGPRGGRAVAGTGIKHRNNLFGESDGGSAEGQRSVSTRKRRTLP